MLTDYLVEIYLEDPEYPHNPDEAQHLTGPPYHQRVLHPHHPVGRYTIANSNEIGTSVQCLD